MSKWGMSLSVCNQSFWKYSLIAEIPGGDDGKDDDKWNYILWKGMKEEWDGLNQVQVSIQWKAAILAVDMKHTEIQISTVLQGEEEKILMCKDT